MPAAGTTGAASTTGAWPGGSGFSVLRGVDTGLNSRLQLLNVAEFLLAGRRRCGLGRRIVCTSSSCLGQQLAIEQLAAVATQGQLTTTGEGHGHRTVHAGEQLLAGKYTITFGQESARSIASDCVNLAYYLSDDTDQRSHESILRNSVANHRRHMLKRSMHPSHLQKSAKSVSQRPCRHESEGHRDN